MTDTWKKAIFEIKNAYIVPLNHWPVVMQA